ncbi:MAG: ABC transporter substrate-binding protein [Candidatus Puniceispirillales bacterium]
MITFKAHSLVIETINEYGPKKNYPDLNILSSTDVDVFEPLIKLFVKDNKQIRIRYVTASTSDIYKEITNSNKSNFDLVISSAMDLQMKLANDGFALDIENIEKSAIPEWSMWRKQIVGFSIEPIVTVISKADFNIKIPKTRRDLISILRNNPNKFYKKIITYDINKSGAGFLFASQDERQSESFWRLAEVMGSLKTKVVCCSSKMLDAVNSRESYIAYNIIGSYAEQRARKQKNLIVVYPYDYTLLLLRSAIIPKNSKNKANANIFLKFLLSKPGQKILEKKGMLSIKNKKIFKKGNIKLIRLDTGLLVYLDKLKRKRFLSEWNEALFQ